MSECETYLLIPTLIYIVSTILLWTILVSFVRPLFSSLILLLFISLIRIPYLDSVDGFSVQAKHENNIGKKFLSGIFCWF